LRDGLDRVSPGLGNPVMKVDVRVEQTPPAADPPPVPSLPDEAALLERLHAMEQRLGQLEARLERPA
jgi:hypothetical protein